MKKCNCEYLSDGGGCIHCGKTVADSIMDSQGRSKEVYSFLKKLDIFHKKSRKSKLIVGSKLNNQRK